MTNDRDPAEEAYRRGVHQGLAMVDNFIHENLSVDPASVIDVARSFARSWRLAPLEPRVFLCHEILKQVKQHLEEVGLLDQ